MKMQLKPGKIFLRRLVKQGFNIGIALVISSLETYSQRPSNINNPVLPGVADAGVIKYNGEYYIGGVFTNGSFYKSNDLVQWKGPEHVFSMKNKWTAGPSAEDSQIHANDINYINGIFHQYWSVNYWGKDRNAIHIGHATSPKIMGEYNEPEKETWLDNRIDPELFIDDDGKLYMYMVKFTDGNTIWARTMENPQTFSGQPVYLFASLPNTWETLDNRVAEGPWVIKYRKRYYMMYNANHTSPGYGNYALGVAEADSPLGFNHGNKYSYPVVKSNQIDLEETYVDLLKFSESEEPGKFLYTFDKPSGEDWKTLKFNDATWKEGKAGFGSRPLEGSTTRNVTTEWKSSDIRLRKSFRIRRKTAGNLMLRISHDGNTKVFLNGSVIYQNEGRKYITVNLDKKAIALLREGENILTVESAGGSRSNFLDVSLFDLKDQVGDEILFSPGQPNILRGPNGFEWWLIYMANKNSEPRGQYINRVHFFDKTLYVDGVTSGNTPGSHPAPADPTFRDLFNEEGTPFTSRWKLQGQWDVKNDELVRGNSGPASALVNAQSAHNYLFEAGIKQESSETKAGIYAWWKDDQNWLQIILDGSKKSWSYIIKEKGQQDSFSFPLPSGFDFTVYHTITVNKNGGHFTIKIDDLPAPGNPLIKTKTDGRGLPGLYCEVPNTKFDGIIYTIGWDECDADISGWVSEVPSGSSARISEKGIQIDGVGSEHAFFKGDSLKGYDFNVQVTGTEDKGSAGIYPLYIDKNNYVKAVINYSNRSLDISGRKNGRNMKPSSISLENRNTYYFDMKYTDFFEKQYSFKSPTYINSIELNKIPHNKPDDFINSIHDKMNISYKSGGKWYPLTFEKSLSAHPGFDKISFNPIKAEGLRFINKEAGDTNYYIYKIWLNEVLKQSYNIRVSRSHANLSFFIDGKEIFQMKDEFPPSKVGLVADETVAFFNGITHYHQPY